MTMSKPTQPAAPEPVAPPDPVVRTEPIAPPEPVAPPAPVVRAALVGPQRVGDPQAPTAKKSFCHRPGCYERFIPDPRAPHQKYCSPECAKAMRRVLVREKRYRDRVQAARLKRSARPSAGPVDRPNE